MSQTLVLVVLKDMYIFSENDIDSVTHACYPSVSERGPITQSVQKYARHIEEFFFEVCFRCLSDCECKGNAISALLKQATATP